MLAAHGGHEGSSVTVLLAAGAMKDAKAKVSSRDVSDENLTAFTTTSE